MGMYIQRKQIIYQERNICTFILPFTIMKRSMESIGAINEVWTG